MLNIHRTLLRRLTLTWLLVSLIIGGGQYYYGIEQIDDQLVDLAVQEAGKISSAHIPMLNDLQADRGHWSGRPRTFCASTSSSSSSMIASTTNGSKRSIRPIQLLRKHSS
jgi:hypothetical protein